MPEPLLTTKLYVPPLRPGLVPRPWLTQRLDDLFEFDYRAKMYQPVAKRPYRYYVMPILHRGRLAGRLDSKADRQAGTLILRALYLEPGQALADELLDSVAGALREFMAFHHMERLGVERSEPEALGAMLLQRSEMVEQM